jgi:hypothetical protein
VEDEEVLLHVLGVVEPVRLARRQHVDPDTQLRERRLVGLEDALGARPLLLPRLRREPLRVANVDDEPALVGGCEAGALVLESCFSHREPPLG